MTDLERWKKRNSELIEALHTAVNEGLLNRANLFCIHKIATARRRVRRLDLLERRLAQIAKLSKGS